MATLNRQDDWARTAIRLPKDVHQQVHEVAQREDRSFNGLLVALIRDGLRLRPQHPLGARQ
ncbi:Arc family DNA-binding protein [Variovorax sp. 38R]|uniref:Arc family DNA-binding protein n=1 Tax=Variovorax sp. 38R TaxID=2774875 RepID=UPI00178317B5|nr:Arc family DNA-binding protein [Variovorax sp. 38R]